jgi:methionine aminopeptidase
MVDEKELSDAESVGSEAEEEAEEVTDLSSSDVCTKYQEAAKIVNLALQGLVSQCVPGGTILDICEFGQTIITTQSAKLYTKKVNGQVVDRGVAFPVCISVNDIVCNHSPLPNE